MRGNECWPLDDFKKASKRKIHPILLRKLLEIISMNRFGFPSSWYFLTFHRDKKMAHLRIIV